jgi:hypothetical protein
MKQIFPYMVLLSAAVIGILPRTGLPAQEVVVSHELIFPLQKEHVHGSSIVELPNGDLLTVWFQGSGERTANDVRLLGARLKKNETAWSPPFDMADTPGIPDCNPVLFLNRKGKLFLIWIAVLADRWERSVLRVRTSTDYENEGPPKWDWQDNILFKPTDDFAKEVEATIGGVVMPLTLTEEQFTKEKQRVLAMSKDLPERSLGWMTRIPPTTLPSGRILLPLYSDGFNFSLTAMSDDDGETWRPSLPMVGLGIQPALAVRSNGDVVAFMRNATGTPERIWISVSKDQGETWSGAVRSDLKSTASVGLLALKDGRWTYIAGDTERGRYRLSLYVSGDEGETWKLGHILEFDITETNRYSYPCMIQGKDGLLQITYSYHLEKERLKSIKYVCIDPAQLP